MSITRTSVLSGNSGTNATSYVTGSATPIAGQILVVAVGSLSNDGTTPPVPTLSGTGGFSGVTWVLADARQHGTALLGAAIYMGFGATGSAGTLTIGFGAEEQGDCCWSVWSIAGGSSNSLYRQSKVGDGTGTAVSVTFDTAPVAANAIFSALVSDSDVTPGTGFTEIHDEVRTSCALETQEKLTGGGSSVPATISSNDDYVMVAVELRAQSDLAVTGISTSTSMGAPTLSLISPTISPAGISSATQMGSPRMTLPLAAGGISTSTVLGAPRMTLPINPSGVSSSTQFGTPSVFNVHRGYFHGPPKVGEYILAYDREAGLYDLGKETRYRGDVVYPQKLRLVGHSWPIEKGMGVYYRDKNGQILDLSEWVVWERGDSTLEVGAYARSLVSAPAEPLSPRITGDATIPGVPAFGTFLTALYNDEAGTQKAQITAQWTTPLNVDGSTIQDGAFYVIRWRRNGQTVFQETTAQWGTNSITILELSNGVSYDFTIEAVDAFNPPNRSGQSSVTTVIAAPDTVGPSKPAPPTLTGEILSVLASHDLGKATGGTFNLESDLARLELHLGSSSGFTPSAATRVGDIDANRTHLINLITAVRSFHYENAVLKHGRVIAYDRSGNPSTPSDSVAVTPGLIPSAAIISLVASKISAGTITATIEMTAATLTGGRIRSAVSGPRVEIQDTNVESIFFFSGDAAEQASTGQGQINVQVIGSGATRSLLLGIRGPQVTTHTQRGHVFLESSRVNGSVKALARMLVIGADSLDKSIVQVQEDFALLGHRQTGRRIQMDGSAMEFVTSTNVLNMEITDTDTLHWQNQWANDFGIFLRAAGDLNHGIYYDPGYDGPILKGYSAVVLETTPASGSNDALRIGAGTNDLVTVNASQFNTFTAIINDVSDGFLKDWSDSENDAQRYHMLHDKFRALPRPGLYRAKGDFYRKEVLGNDAWDFPEEIVRYSCLQPRDEDGAARILRSVSPSAAFSWMQGELNHALDAIERRLDALERNVL